MACTISVNFEKAPALKALEQYCGTNCTQFYSYCTTVIRNINADGELEFKEDFIKNGWKCRQPLDIKTSDPVKVRDAIIKYLSTIVTKSISYLSSLNKLIVCNLFLFNL